MRSIFDKNLLSNLRLLLAIANHFKKSSKALIMMPRSVKVNVIKVRKTEGKTTMEIVRENLM